MAFTYLTAPGAGQAISTAEIKLKIVTLTAGSANATLSIKANGTEIQSLAALIGTTVSWAPPSGNLFDQISIGGAVTADLVGAGSKARFDY